MCNPLRDIEAAQRVAYYAQQTTNSPKLETASNMTPRQYPCLEWGGQALSIEISVQTALALMESAKSGWVGDSASL